MFWVLSLFLRHCATSFHMAPVSTAMGIFVPSDIYQYSISIRLQGFTVPG